MTDLAGSASAVVTLDVQGAPVVPAPAAAGPPQLTGLRVRCVKPRTGRLCRIRISFKLSERATVKVSLRRVGARKSLGTVTIRGRTGTNAVLLPAKVRRKALKAGRVRLSITATAGTRTSTAVARTVKVKAVRKARR